MALARKLAVILHRMLVENVTHRPFESHAKLASHADSLDRAEEESKNTVFGRVSTPAFPKRSPLAGTMDQVRPLPIHVGTMTTHL